MLNFSPLLGINLPILGKRNSLITPLRFYPKSQFAGVELTQINPLGVNPPLIQPARLLGTNSTHRLYHSNQQSEIGWDNWQPIDRSSDCDDFDYKVDRSHFNIEDRSSRTDRLESPDLDFFTTVLPTEFAEIDSQIDSLSTNSIDVEKLTPTNKDRSTTDPIQPQSPGKIQPKPVESDRKLLESNQIEQSKQPKSSVQSPQVFANIQPQQIPKVTPEPLGTRIALSLDNFALTATDASFLETLPGISIDLDLDVPRSSDLDLTQTSRSVVDRASLQESRTTPNLASSPELIPDQIVSNLLDTPTITNPIISPKVSPLEPTINTTIIPESSLSPAILTPFTVQKQIARTTEIAPIGKSSDRLRSDPIASNSLDSQPPEVAITQPPRLEQRSTTTEDILSVPPLAVEPVRESISDTFPLDLADSLITNQPLSTDPAQISASLDEFAIVNLDDPVVTSTLPSNLTPTTSQLLADRAQIAATPNQIPPEIQFPQSLNPATAQLNLAADRRNIDRDLDSVQLNQENLNIPESLSTLPADILPTNLLPALNPAKIATSATPVEIEADLESTQLLNTDIFQLDRLDATTINRAPSALEQASIFSDKPISENLENSQIPIIEATNTLSIDPDLTIKSIPTLSLDSSQFNMDISLPTNLLLESTEVIEVDQANPIEASNEFSSNNLSTSPIADRSSIDQSSDNPLQTISKIEHFPVDIVNSVENQINNSTNTIQLDQLITELPEVDREKLPLRSIDLHDDNVEDNSADITIPAPTVGYATGGYVQDANHIDLQSIASSDTVSAMLTPGEFVINAKDAQKNLDLLTHINRGGEPETVLPNTEIQPSIIESPSTSTDISPASIQRKRNDSLISPSLQQEIGLQQLSPLINPGLDPFQSSQTESTNSSPTYSSPLMIFRKPISSPQPQYTGTDTPDRWESIEDLINGGSNKSDMFNFENISPQQPDLESQSLPIISPQYTSPTRGFADGGEVTPSDIATTIEPVTQTIESPINNPQSQPENNDPAELEILAREIYHRLRQRLEIERERHGSYSGNLAW
jgi:hypothetical protein